MTVNKNTALLQRNSRHVLPPAVLPRMLQKCSCCRERVWCDNLLLRPSYVRVHVRKQLWCHSCILHRFPFSPTLCAQRHSFAQWFPIKQFSFTCHWWPKHSPLRRHATGDTSGQSRPAAAACSVPPCSPLLRVFPRLSPLPFTLVWPVIKG